MPSAVIWNAFSSGRDFGDKHSRFTLHVKSAFMFLESSHFKVLSSYFDNKHSEFTLDSKSAFMFLESSTLNYF